MLMAEICIPGQHSPIYFHSALGTISEVLIFACSVIILQHLSPSSCKLDELGTLAVWSQDKHISATSIQVLCSRSRVVHYIKYSNNPLSLLGNIKKLYYCKISKLQVCFISKFQWYQLWRYPWNFRHFIFVLFSFFGLRDKDGCEGPGCGLL